MRRFCNFVVVPKNKTSMLVRIYASYATQVKSTTAEYASGDFLPSQISKEITRMCHYMNVTDPKCKKTCVPLTNIL